MLVSYLAFSVSQPFDNGPRTQGVANQRGPIMRILLFAFILFCGALNSSAVHAGPAQSGKILLVASGHGRDEGRTQPGFEMDEFAQAWAVFRDNGFEVELASPSGGPVQADKFDVGKPYNARALADPKAMRQLGATIATGSVDPSRYAAVYVLGGGGAMFDLFADPALQKLLAANYEAGGVVGGVCHGPAVFSAVRLSDGRFLVDGRRVTGFTNDEEKLFGERWSSSYPLLLETGLRDRGARFEQGAVMLPFVVADGRLVTGQNPFSTALTAEAMVRAMGREPITRQPYADERSLLLVARFLKGERQQAASELGAETKGYDVPLIGVYGDILAAQAGKDAARLETALSLMHLAASKVWHPRLELAIAGAEHRSGLTPAARRRVERVLEKKPDMAAARALLSSLKD